MHNRKSIRLKNWDYGSEGAYFITLLVKNRNHLFGEIKNDKVNLSIFGEIAENEWLNTTSIRSNIVLDEFVIMPDHMHAIIIITDNVNSNLKTFNTKLSSPANTFGAVIIGYKGTVTKKNNELRNTPSDSVWQRNYFDRIIRNENEYNRVCEYIYYNPLKWEIVNNNPENYKLK